MEASFDSEVNAYYFGGNTGKVAQTIDLGTRQVLLDVDSNGKIVGVEVL